MSNSNLITECQASFIHTARTAFMVVKAVFGNQSYIIVSLFILQIKRTNAVVHTYALMWMYDFEVTAVSCTIFLENVRKFTGKCQWSIVTSFYYKRVINLKPGREKQKRLQASLSGIVLICWSAATLYSKCCTFNVMSIDMYVLFQSNTCTF